MKGSRTPLLVLFVTAFVDMVGLTMVVPLLPFYATEYGASASLVGVLVSAFSVAQLAAAPLWGRFSDRYGRRPAILAGLVVTAVAYLLFAAANSVAALFLSRVIQGLGGGTIGVVQAYVADTSLPEQRVKSLGWLSAVTSLGAVAGPAFGSAMVALGGRHAPGLGAAILSLFVALFAWRFLRESRVHTTAGADPASRTTSRSVMLRILTRWNEPASRLIWIYAIAIGAFYGTIQLAPLLLQARLQVTEQTVGYFVMYLGAIGVIVRALVLGRVVDRLGEARLSRLGIVLLAFGLAATGLSQGGPLLAAGFTLMPLGTAFLFPCITGLLSRVIPTRDRGLYMGVQHTFGGISRVAFPVGAGILMDRFGVGVPFWIAGLLVLATLPLTAALDRWLAAVPVTRSQAVEARNLAAADITGEIRLDPPGSREG